MAQRFALPKRVRVQGDPALAHTYLKRGETLLGMLLEHLRFNKLKTGKRISQQEDGAIITVSTDGTLAVIDIDVTDVVAEQPSTATFGIWIPRGFVVYPASDSSSGGWGLPILLDDSKPATDPTNLAPGLDVTRWTVDGGLGQVLLTRVAKAGYPPTNQIAIPLLFNFTTGLRPTHSQTSPDLTLDQATNAWAAYRLELKAFQANSPTANQVEQSSIIANKVTEFTLVNARRVSLSLSPLNYPIRGFYDIGQGTAEIEYANSVLAHYSDKLPDTYQTPEDRAGHDGTTEQVSAALANDRNKTFSAGEILFANGDYVSTSTDPNGDPIYTLTSPAPDVDALSAYNFWITDPPHAAIVESTDYDDKQSTLQPGFKHNVAAAEFVLHEQWVYCGNQQWLSSHPEIPALSWFGPHSLNLAWETWPMEPTNVHATPLAKFSDFVLPFDDEGLCWLQNYYTATLASPMWDNRIFCRGRCIAIAPYGGLVWAAAMQKIPATGLQPAFYRMVALVHNQADQSSTVTTCGMTATLHVWYVDLPNGFNYAGNPQTVIRGVYGLEDASWPWITKNSPFSWRDGGTVDVSRSAGGTQDLLKYASQWRFSADGTRAVCLRDVGAFADYASIYDLSSVGISGTYRLPRGRIPAACELTCTTDAGPLSCEFIFRGLAAGAASAPAGVDPVGGENVRRVMLPIAVDYDGENNIVAAFDIHTADAALMPPFIAETNSTLVLPFGRFAVGFGAYNANYAGLTYNSEIGSYISRATLPVHTMQPAVLDVGDGVFTTLGTRSSGLATSGDDSVGVNNPDFIPCFVDTPANVVRIGAYRQGMNLSSKWYGDPDHTLYTLQDVNLYVGGSPTDVVALVYSNNPNVLTSYVKNRAGDYVFSYLFTPQPDTSFNVDAASFDCATDPLHAPRIDPTFLRFNTTADVLCRGGWAASSFASEGALYDMMGTTGTNPRLLYARAA